MNTTEVSPNSGLQTEQPVQPAPEATKVTSLTRALKEVKLLDKRIAAFSSTLYAALEVSGRLQKMPMTSEAFITDTKSSLQQLKQLFDNRTKIRRALAEANITTMVTVGSKKVSIVEAIDLKSSYVLLKNAYKKAMKDIVSANSDLEKFEENLMTKIDEQTKSALSNKSQIPKDTIATLQDNYRSLYNPKVISGVTLEELDKAITEIDEFLEEVDTALSEINASTYISIPQ